MTLLIAIHANGYALLAADKMESIQVLGYIVPSHREATKILETSIGAISGSGLVPLLDAVKHRIQTESVSHTDQMLSIIHEERERERERALERGDARQHDLDHTSWFMTYRARAEHGIAVRCVGYVPMLEDQRFIVVEPGKVQSVFPSDTPPEVVDRVVSHLRANIRPTDGSADPTGLYHHLNLVSWAISEVSLHSTQVSTTFDLAVTTPKGTWCPLYSFDALHPALEQISGWGPE